MTPEAKIKSEPFNAVIMIEDLGDGRVRKLVVDTDTGEIMLKVVVKKS